MTKFGIQVTALIAGFVLLGLGYIQWRDHQRMVGWESALRQIETQNTEARALAGAARTTVKGCFESGGGWDVISRSCIR